MKLSVTPTLANLRNIMGEKLYVDFIWMARERALRADPGDRYAWLSASAGQRTSHASAFDPSLVAHRGGVAPGDLWQLVPEGRRVGSSLRSEAA
jgi:hypothetical protein